MNLLHQISSLPDAAIRDDDIFYPYKWIACILLVLTNYSIDVFLAIIATLYVLQLVYIFRERNNVAVQTRSPWILLLGGISLLTDSMINFVI